MDIREILTRFKNIAVVGVSDKPERPSYQVAKFLMEKGYKVFPVNPNLDSFLGQKAYKSLEEIPEKVEIVDVFRKTEEVPAVAKSSVAIGAKVLWQQEGVNSPEAREIAEAAGLVVIADRCIKKEYLKNFP
ncbi:CoA-binding protein [Carboxydothermus islandicus]|uniref:CoA-binding protein n=1 Tax=Carboxydothermus islandicus TaxID=661089 RepID=A0A1L8CZU8_9THEO|nr:CoA-binding protein [Carboxydothermus islandicus]GAV24409.1 CoA-binding protein [Carboxydothermus islandicus]